MKRRDIWSRTFGIDSKSGTPIHRKAIKATVTIVADAGSIMCDFLFLPQVAENGNPHDYYIPENIFYRLCMKAKNEVAEAFQAKVADEIIPSIRKTGKYEVGQKPIPSYMLASEEERAIAWAEEHRQARLALEAKDREIASLQAQNGVLSQDYVSNKDVCNELLAQGLAKKKNGQPYALSTLKSKVSPLLQKLSNEKKYGIAEETVIVDGVERKTPYYHVDIRDMVLDMWREGKVA